MHALPFLCNTCKSKASRLLDDHSHDGKMFHCPHNKVRVRLHARGCRWEFDEGLIQTSPIHVMPKGSIRG